MTVANEPLSCPILLTPIVLPVQTDCAHIFEQDALYNWINSQREQVATCPCCREPIDPAKLIIGKEITVAEPNFVPAARQQPNRFMNLASASTANRQTAADTTVLPMMPSPVVMFSSVSRMLQHGAGLINTLVNHTPPPQSRIDFGGGMIGMIFSNIFTTFSTALKVCCGMADFMSAEATRIDESTERNNRLDL